MEDTFFQKLLKSPFVLVAAVFLFFVILYHVWEMTGRLLSFYGEKKQLEAKIAELQKKNEDIKKEIDYAGTEGFLEREGKARLNLKKPGEEVAVIVSEKEEKLNNQHESKSVLSKMLGAVISFFGF